MNRTTLRDVAFPLASLVVLVIVGYLAYSRVVGNRVISRDPAVSDAGRIELPADEASSILPADLPIPPDAAISGGYEVASAEGDVQGTRTYDSPRSVAQERVAYEDYIARTGWTVTDRQQASGYAALLAERDGRQLIASFSARGALTSVTVTAVAAPATY